MKKTAIGILGGLLVISFAAILNSEDIKDKVILKVLKIKTIGNKNNEKKGSIKINFTDADMKKGNIIVNLYKENADFVKDAPLESKTLKEGESEIVFDNVEYGDYKLIAFTDKDKTGKLTQKMLDVLSEKEIPGKDAGSKHKKIIIKRDNNDVEINEEGTKKIIIVKGDEKEKYNDTEGEGKKYKKIIIVKEDGNTKKEINIDEKGMELKKLQELGNMKPGIQIQPEGDFSITFKYVDIQ